VCPRIEHAADIVAGFPALILRPESDRSMAKKRRLSGQLADPRAACMDAAHKPVARGLVSELSTARSKADARAEAARAELVEVFHRLDQRFMSSQLPPEAEV
jgi:hypothetical protein